MNLKMEISHSIANKDVITFEKIFQKNINLIHNQTSTLHSSICIPFIQDIFKSDNVEIFDIFLEKTRKYVESERSIGKMSIDRYIGLLTMKENMQFLNVNIMERIVEKFENQDYLMTRLFYNKILLTSDKRFFDIFYTKNAEKFLCYHFTYILINDSEMSMDIAKYLIDICQKDENCKCYSCSTIDLQSLIYQSIGNDNKYRLLSLLDYYFLHQKTQSSKEIFFEKLLKKSFEMADADILEYFTQERFKGKEIVVNQKLFHALVDGIVKFRKINILRSLYKKHDSLIFQNIKPYQITDLYRHCGFKEDSPEFEEMVWIIYRKTSYESGEYVKTILEKYKTKWSLFTKHVIDNSLLDRDTINIICSYV